MLVDDDVYDETRKCVGLMEDILDSCTGCVRCAVVALGEFLGLGRQRFAVAWGALTPDAKYRRCVLNLTMMRLLAIPISGEYARLAPS